MGFNGNRNAWSFPWGTESRTQPQHECPSGLISAWVSWVSHMFLLQLPVLSKKHLLPLTDLMIPFDTVLLLPSHPWSVASPSLPVPMLSWSALPALERLWPKPVPRRSSPVLLLANPPGPCSLFLSALSSKSGHPMFLHTPLDSSFIALVPLGRIHVSDYLHNQI